MRAFHALYATAACRYSGVCCAASSSSDDDTLQSGAPLSSGTDDGGSSAAQSGRRSFEAADVVDTVAQPLASEPGTAGAPPRWQLWQDELLSSDTTAAAAGGAARDAAASPTLVALVVPPSAALAPPPAGPPPGRSPLLAWARRRVRALRQLVAASRWGAACVVLATIAAQAWGRPALNERVLPWASASASAACGRSVRVGRVRWLLPSGVTGLTPVATLGPSSVGPAAVGDGSSAVAQGLSVWFRPLASLLQRRPVLHVVAHAPHVKLVQGYNRSWLGYPEDTIPSSRPVPGSSSPRPAAAAPSSEASHSRPPLHVSGLSITDGTCELLIHSDAQPRFIHGVGGALRLWPDLRRMEVDVQGRVAQRDTRSERRITMLMSDKRHLRDNPTAAETAAEAAEVARRGDGGRVRVHVGCAHMGVPERWPELTVKVEGTNLHAPMLEHLLDVPIDVHSGNLTGEVRLHCNDEASWDFPLLSGSVAGTGLRFHIVDAPDDFAGVDAHFLLDGRRIYLHGARGMYGAIPLTATGDIDVTPQVGEYHLSATVPSVEANDLRETLGGRPPPRALAAALKGVLHCTGPLEKPVFMGTVTAHRDAQALASATQRLKSLNTESPATSPADASRATQLGWAVDALERETQAVAAYDRVAFDAVKAVWSLDTQTNVFVLHDALATPAGGAGAVRASGTLRVDPAAELDPSAMRVDLSGTGVDPAYLVRAYHGALPDGVDVPPSLVPSGPASFTASIAGSLLEPGVDVVWEAPQSEASGSVHLSRSAIDASVRTPSLDASARLDTEHPSIETALAARTPLESMAAAEFSVVGADAELNMRNLDVVALTHKDPQDAADKRDRLRLRLSGKTRFTGKRDLEAAATASGPAYKGDLQLQALRLNQLVLAPNFGGSFSVSPAGVHIDARGRPDEAMVIDFLPAQDRAPSDAGIAAPPPLPPTEASASAEGDESPAYGADLERSAMTALAATAAADADEALPSTLPPRLSVSLRRGQLRCEATVAGGVSTASLAFLRLDDLEIASLRGRLDEATLALDFDKQKGSGALRVSAPRFSGLQGERLSAEGVWDGDVVRLERVHLAQSRSTYTLQGEYELPTAGAASMEGKDTADGHKPGRWNWRVEVPHAEIEEMLPAVRLLGALQKGTNMRADYARAKAEFLDRLRAASGAAADALHAQIREAVARATGPGNRLAADIATPGGSGAVATLSSADGQVAVNGAVSASALTPSGALAPASAIAASAGAGGASSGLATSTAAVPAVSPPPSDSGAKSQVVQPSAAGGGLFAGEELPGLQDLRGNWRGVVSATGGKGNDASVAVTFDLAGEHWSWGDSYAVERMDAAGSYNSLDGLCLDKLHMRSGLTALRASGQMLGPKQSATFRLDDFPAPMVETLYRAATSGSLHTSTTSTTAAANAAGDAASSSTNAQPRRGRNAQGSARSRGRVGRDAAARGTSPLGGLTPSLGASAAGSQAAGDLSASSSGGAEGAPLLSGLLYVSGDLAGSASAPEGKVSVRLVDGAVRSTRLAVAEAAAALTANQRVAFDLALAPAAGEGHVKVTGSAPVPGWPRAAQDVHADSDGGSGDGSSLLVDASVKDAGMLLLSSMAPPGAVEWKGGAADVGLQVRGTLARPIVDGTATVHKATVALPCALPRPMSNLNAAVRVRGNTLHVDTLEGRLGRKGHLRVKGTLPLRPPAPGSRGSAGAAWTALVSKGDSAAQHGMRVDIVGGEVRAERKYSGLVDASLSVRGALLAPEVSGEVTLARGIAYLSSDMPAPGVGGGGGGAPSATGQGALAAAQDATAGVAPRVTLQRPGAAAAGTGAGAGELAAGTNAPSDSTVPTPLPGSAQTAAGPSSGLTGWFRSAAARAEQARRAAAQVAATAVGSSAMSSSPSSAVTSAASVTGTPGGGVSFQGLRVRLGPELRVVYPLLLNFGIAGELEVTGSAGDAAALRPVGTIVLTNGEVNLLATQAHLNREHANTVVFDPDHGLDPLLDVCLNSADLRVLVQGRASAWQNGMTITRPGAPGGEAAPLSPAEAARVFEGQLAESLLQGNGQLAFSNLAASTMATLLPKIETQGQLGSARWRLVSAPTIAGLLSLDPSTDPFKGLASLTLGTEVEVQFGPSFTASVSRKVKDSDMETQFSAIYQLSPKLRMQLNAVSSSLTRLLLQFNS